MRNEETTTTVVAPANEEEKDKPRKTLKIEVHATATHHKQQQQQHEQLVEPVVAHAQAHEFSHSQSVSDYDERVDYFSRCPSRILSRGPTKLSRNLSKQKAAFEHIFLAYATSAFVSKCYIDHTIVPRGTKYRTLTILNVKTYLQTYHKFLL